MMRQRSGILAIASAVACGSVASAADDDESTSDPAPASSDSADASDADADSGAPESSTSAGGSELCGNGVADLGEACDGNGCCADDCTLVGAGATCRPVADPCDVAEACDGVAAECPADQRVAATEPVVLPAVAMADGGTYPRATRLADGTLLGVYEHYVAASDQLVLSAIASDDDALQWAPLADLAAEPATPGRTLGNPHPIQLADGTVLVAFRHHDPAPVGINYRLLVSASPDLGQTWTFRGEIETFVSSSVGIWEPFLFLTPAGTLQVYYAKERDGGAAQDIVLRSSTDAGATWGLERVVAGAPGSRDGMPGVTVLQDGSLLAVFESFRDPGTNNRFVVRSAGSADDGVSWQDRAIVFAPIDPLRNAGAPQVVTLADGRVAASFMTDDGAPASDWPNAAATVLVLSQNAPSFGDLVWSAAPVVVAPASSYWPGLADADTFDPLVLFDAGGVRSTYACLP